MSITFKRRPLDGPAGSSDEPAAGEVRRQLTGAEAGEAVGDLTHQSTPVTTPLAARASAQIGELGEVRARPQSRR